MRVLARLALALPFVLVAACAAEPEVAQKAAAPAAVALKINLGPDQNRIRAKKVDAIAAKVPEAIRKTGELKVGTEADTSPPLSFLADDDATPIGVEIDLAQLLADVLGLKLTIDNTSWENVFLSVRSGKNDAALTNVTVTEERKDIYDFATYRSDQLAWEVTKTGGINAIAKPADIAGLTVVVGAGTNQEKILLEWAEQNKTAGLKPTQVQYFQKASDYYLALKSGRVHAYLGPNPTIAYHVAVAGDTKIAGTLSGAGDGLQGLIAAMSKKGSGLAEPFAEALNTVIANGQYEEVLKRWGLENEAVPKSLVNPPGLPRQAQ
jgi:polar amino acid transport system substrate-binding protein